MRHGLPNVVQGVCNNLPHGDSENVPQQIPKEWKKCAEAFFCDTAWCKAVIRVLWSYGKSKDVTKTISEHPIPKVIPKVRKKIQGARWAKENELPQGKLGALKENCGRRGQEDCIIIDRAIFGPIGDKRELTSRTQ